MKCKKCGYSLPPNGYICTHCGVMMSLEQIEEQKKQNQGMNRKEELLSERYHKGFIYKKREEIKPKYVGILFVFVFLLLLVLLGVFVYF